MANTPIACYNISGMLEFPKKESAIKIDPEKNIDNNVNRLAYEIDKSFNSVDKIDLICKNGLSDLQKNYDWEKSNIEIY